MKFNILVTSSGTVTSQGVIKGLHQQSEFEYRLITTDMDEFNAGKYFGDGFYKVPAATHSDYIAALLEICKKEKIQILIPIYDPELLKVAENKKAFMDLGCTPVISDPETIGICNDKYLTYQFFKTHGIPTPETHRAEDVLSGKASLPFPIFGKPAHGIAAQGTTVLKTMEELKGWSAKIQEPLVQSLLEGKEFSIDTLCDLKSRVIEVVPRTREDTKHGASVKGVTVKDRELMQWAKDIAEKLKIMGPCNIQCFKSAAGKISFFEINPRFSAAHAHSIAAGMNSPLEILKMVSGQKVEPRIGSFHDGIKMMRYWAEVFATPDQKLFKKSSL